ncbi:MAG TPA: glycoside hydrolase family 15 protein [Polyangiaceae bacterium]|nr:glycoside hydrolase family 15 protein [Polyangiaceae bacterium]
MPLRIEDYALIGDTQTAALVGRDGSIDWLCAPRFDSGACFAALLGAPEHGRWLIAPRGADLARTTRAYRDGTLVLDSTFETPEGRVRVTDCMPPRDRAPEVVRVVEGLEGDVPMQFELVVRFDYGSILPWVTRAPDARLRFIGGADSLVLESDVETQGRGMTTVADFSMKKGERRAFVLSWHPSHEEPPPARDAAAAVGDTETWWRAWSRRCAHRGPFHAEVGDSLRVLKALCYAPTGGIVAAPSMGLPERLGGVRNWDYRFCWLRDATFVLYAFTLAGYETEAKAWRDWLLRAIAGDPAKLQVLYGLAGERRLTEREVPWLPGYEGAHPVRLGNAAVDQFQLDVYGEVIDAFHQTFRTGLALDQPSWNVERGLLEFLESAWERPDDGLWEVRGPRRHFTHSKIMAWVAFDRAVRTVEHNRVEGPVERWRKLRDEIHADVCAHGFDAKKRAFTQWYGSDELDASLLMIPQLGFLPANDARVVGTVAAVERELLKGGFVLRYPTVRQDGLPPDEGVFLACSFWLADCYALMNRKREAEALYRRLLALRNDVGLLAEEYDPDNGRQLGNFPQAFSHVGLVNTAYNLTPHHTQPAVHRRGG